MANAQANSAQAAENNAALQRAGLETAGTLAGAYFGSQKGTGTQLYGGQTYGAVKGYGGQTYSPGLTDTGALYYSSAT
jgi:hypothetical protein